VRIMRWMFKYMNISKCVTEDKATLLISLCG
jgi:hypothetical protein